MNLKRGKEILAACMVILTVIALIYTFTDSVLEWWHLRKDVHYGITTKITFGSSGRYTTLKYIFKINNTLYQDYTTLSLKRDGTHYFVKFYPNDPNYNEPTKIIADSVDIKNLPVDGYKDLPHQ